MSRPLAVQDLSLQGKNALLRVDFNVPLDNQANITDDTRLVAALPTIQHILNQGGSVVLMSHLGRPKGQRVDSLSLAPIAKRLGQLLNRNVQFASDCVGPEVEQQVKNLAPGDLLLLENLRFHAAEEKPEKDPAFAEQLARLGDVYINDAFGTAHRAHSSTVTIAQYFPGKAAAGFLMQKEVEFLGTVMKNPPRPFFAIVGGKKISTKLGVLESLLHKADGLFLGGAMTFTFLRAQGIRTGKSLVEEDLIPQAQALMEKCQQNNVKLWLPVDVVAVPQLDENSDDGTVINVQDGIPDTLMGVDIGPKTIDLYAKELLKARCVLWNGPLGVFEIAPFAKGTHAIAKTLAKSDATTIIGGGDSVAAINQLGIVQQFDHLSTGGGASLEYIEHGTLPGIEALTQVEKQMNVSEK